MVTIEELKKKGGFVVISNEDLLTRKGITGYYEFTFKWGRLYISGDAFGEQKHRVRNAFETLFNISKETRSFTVKIKGVEIEITYPELQDL